VRIVVLMKQVPETTQVEIDPEKGTLRREGVHSQANPFDLHALEAALSMSQSLDATVKVISMGPPQAVAVIKEALAMGANDGILLSDRAFAGADTLATGFTLSRAIQICGFDLVIAGQQSTDGDTAQVGPCVAEFLGIPHVSYVNRILSFNSKNMIVVSHMGDRLLTQEIEYPCLITVTRELNYPRLPSYIRWKESRHRQVTVWGHEHIAADGESYFGLDGSPTRVERIFPPSREAKRELWEGDVRLLAERFCNFLSNRG
jgi:electron transfer flavoprotein beta subunit